MLSSGTNPARDDLVERPLAVNARDPHMRDIGAGRAGEAAVELGADCGRDAEWTAHIGRREAGALDGGGGDRLLGRTHLDGETRFGAVAGAGGDGLADPLPVNARDSHMRGIRGIRSGEMTIERAADPRGYTRSATYIGRSKAGLLVDEPGDRLLRLIRSDGVCPAGGQRASKQRDDRAGSPHARHYRLRLMRLAAVALALAAGSAGITGAASAHGVRVSCRSGRTLFRSHGVRAFLITSYFAERGYRSPYQTFYVCRPHSPRPRAIFDGDPFTRAEASGFRVFGVRLGFVIHSEGFSNGSATWVGWLDLRIGRLRV